MKYFNRKYDTANKEWLVCEGDETNTCAGTYETEDQAKEVEGMLNDAYSECQ